MKNETISLELRDEIMRKTTGDFLTESFSFDEFTDDDFDISHYTWEPFENWNEDEYWTLIFDSYSTTVSIIKGLSNE